MVDKIDERQLEIEHRLTKIETELYELSKSIKEMREEIREQVAVNTSYASKISKLAIYLSVSSLTIVLALLGYVIVR